VALRGSLAFTTVSFVKRCAHNPGLHRFAVFTAAATLFLICVGGIVTSKGAGLAVPDWPNTFGYNMFLFPISKWVGGIFYEHTHRLVASGVGLLTTILAIWLWLKEPREWVRWLGIMAFLAVVLQGVLGGLRVTQLKDELGIFHGTLAQLFFVLVSSIALFTSNWWLRSEPAVRTGLRPVYAAIACLIFLQLVIGATMRHQHAGLAIPDFPMAYGKWWPATDSAAVERYNGMRMEAVALNPITAAGVILQMIHRVMAIMIALGALLASWLTIRKERWNSLNGRMAALWCVSIICQIGLGAATVLTNKSADIATAHVAVGAVTLMLGVLLILAASRRSVRFSLFSHDPLVAPASRIAQIVTSGA
jgi:cytochrome c oxidase assembly protein subunit 15